MSKAEYMKVWRKENRAKIREYMRGYRDANRDLIRKLHTDWVDSHYESRLLHQAKFRAKKHNREFNLTLGDINIPTHCPILGIELFRAEGKPKANSPTIDRIHNDLGYVPGNVWVISHKANTQKKDKPLSLFLKGK